MQATKWREEASGPAGKLAQYHHDYSYPIYRGLKRGCYIQEKLEFRLFEGREFHKDGSKRKDVAILLRCGLIWAWRGC